jgi:CRISPR-associated endonuclease/helicase Cas3
MSKTNSEKLEFIAHRRETDGLVQLLDEHLISVGRICRRNAAKINLPMSGELIGLLHDLGKYSKEFQNYIASATGLLDQDADEFVDAGKLRGKIDHSTAGAQYIWQKIQNINPHNRILAQFLSLCIVSHHSGLIDCIIADGEDNFSKRMSKPQSKTHLDEAVTHLNTGIKDRVEYLLEDSQLADELINALKGIANTEQKNGSRKTEAFKAGLLARMLFSCLIDADRLDTADFEMPDLSKKRNSNAYVAWDILINRLEDHLAAFETSSPIDCLRQNISDECRAAADRNIGCYTLTVPTGGGKTLASLRFALHHAYKHRLERVIFVIPFTSIIDQNADVVRRILEPSGTGIDSGSIVLEHHSNLTPERQTWRNKTLSENWDAPIVFTTSVQFLETIFGGGTCSARRMHQLAKSVIIFDEAQTIPVRSIHMFNNCINFLVDHCTSTVVLCTATQPLLNAVDPQKGAARVSGELISDTQSLFKSLKRVEVRSHCRPGGWSDDDVARLAYEETAAAKSCLIIVNTRKAALSLYRVFAQDGAEGVYHLSTSMCPAHRRIVLNEIRERLTNEAPTICVSTQLIEAGVDVDFGAVIRFVAGLDSITQAAGRCNRNGRAAFGRVHIVNPAEETIDRLIDISAGRDITRRILNEFAKNPNAFNNDLLSIQSIFQYFKYYFFQRANEMSYSVPPAIAMRDDTLLMMLSYNDLAVHQFKQRYKTPPSNYLRQAFMTSASAFRAIDAPACGIIVQYGAEGRSLVQELCQPADDGMRYKLLRRAQQFSINVFEYVFKTLADNAAISEIFPGSGIYYLHQGYYSDLFGLKDMETIY